MLLRALVEAEIDGAALANQLTELKETVTSIAKVNMVPVKHTCHTDGREEKINTDIRKKIRVVVQ